MFEEGYRHQASCLVCNVIGGQMNKIFDAPARPNTCFEYRDIRQKINKFANEARKIPIMLYKMLSKHLENCEPCKLKETTLHPISEKLRLQIDHCIENENRYKTKEEWELFVGRKVDVIRHGPANTEEETLPYIGTLAFADSGQLRAYEELGNEKLRTCMHSGCWTLI